ncbi:hypothetical protein GCM10027064_00220 [Microbacterium petrolearium]
MSLGQPVLQRPGVLCHACFLPAAPGAAFRQTSVVFACGYAGLAMPVLGLGAALRVLPLPTGLWCFAAVTAALCAAAFALARR